MTELNPFEMAPAAVLKPKEQVDLDGARQVFPVMFDKDDMDFRPEENDIFVSTPKGSAREHVSELTSLSNLTTGLEDVSSEDLELENEQEKNVQTPVGTGI